MGNNASEIATVAFIDQETQDEGVLVVRASASVVGLAVSLRQDGDVEVFLNPEDTRRLLDSLEAALAQCETPAAAKGANETGR